MWRIHSLFRTKDEKNLQRHTNNPIIYQKESGSMIPKTNKKRKIRSSQQHAKTQIEYFDKYENI